MPSRPPSRNRAPPLFSAKTARNQQTGCVHVEKDAHFVGLRRVQASRVAQPMSIFLPFAKVRVDSVIRRHTDKTGGCAARSSGRERRLPFQKKAGEMSRGPMFKPVLAKVCPGSNPPRRSCCGCVLAGGGPSSPRGIASQARCTVASPGCGQGGRGSKQLPKGRESERRGRSGASLELRCPVRGVGLNSP